MKRQRGVALLVVLLILLLMMMQKMTRPTALHPPT